MNAAAATSPTCSVSPQHQSFLAFDYGSARIGVASGNRLLHSATARRTIQTRRGDVFGQVAEHIQEWQPDALVVGVPFHPDGNPHDNTQRAQKFARQLRGRFGLQVYEVDERYSTTEALSDRHADADAGAACIILEQFLRGLR
ncbi:MAG: hypothetical protein RLZZ126_953 [Pseudomonadota bacterium]|jgi:putative holliday junction resolvase